MKTNSAAQQMELKKANTETNLFWVVHFLCTLQNVSCGAYDNLVRNEWFCMCIRRGQWNAHTNATFSHESRALGTVEMKNCECLKLDWNQTKKMD